MPILLLAILLVPLLAGCVPGGTRSDGVPSADAPFTLTALDVGQGDALLLRTSQAVVLLDTGDPTADVVRLLAREGVSRIDLLVLTHPHVDHVGGALEVLRSLPVGSIWLRPLEPDAVIAPELAAALRLAHTTGIPVRAPPAGAQVRLGDIRLEVLGPPPGTPYTWTQSPTNNHSIVLRASVPGSGSVLLAGDAEREAQSDLLATFGGRLRSDVLVVPHHGSRTSAADFLTGVGAHTAVISVGRRNRHGHPHPTILAVLEQAGMRIRRTDEEGTVRLPIGPAARPFAVGRSQPSGAVPRMPQLAEFNG
jgi:competence protein ComEC